MDDWLLIVCAAVVPTAAAVLGWVKFYFERRDRRIAEGKSAEAQTELAAMKARAPDLVPYFVPSDRIFGVLKIHAGKNGETALLVSGRGYLLDFRQNEVPPDYDGKVVYLVVENDGAAATEMHLDMDGDQITIEEAINRECVGLFVLIYPYNRAKRDQTQTLTLRFMTRDGARHIHRYETMHGMRWLKRIDPA